MKEIVREISGLIMMACFMLCYIPQIFKIYKNNSSKDVSLMLVILSLGGYISGMVYLFTSTFGLWWFINYCVGIVMCLLLMHAWFKFKKDEEYDSY
jgi:uncharacterized protein with PQ loop repeat